MSVSAAPEQMCLPKSMGNYTMYAGTRIPSAEPHRLACGFSQKQIERIAEEIDKVCIICNWEDVVSKYKI